MEEQSGAEQQQQQQVESEQETNVTPRATPSHPPSRALQQLNLGPSFLTMVDPPGRVPCGSLVFLYWFFIWFLTKVVLAIPMKMSFSV